MYPFRITIAANQMFLGENDNLAATEGDVFLPSKATLFLPVLVVAAGYAILLTWLWSAGNIGSGIARLAIIVLAVGVPLLFIHALLRYVSIRVRLLDGFVQLNPGFPRRDAANIPYAHIDRIDLKTTGLAGNSGTLIFRLTQGKKVAICDLDHPVAIRDEIVRRIEADWQMHRSHEHDNMTSAVAASNR